MEFFFLLTVFIFIRASTQEKKRDSPGNDMNLLLTMQTIMRMGGREERRQSTIISEDEDGGREEEIKEPVAILTITVSPLMSSRLEVVQLPAGPVDTLSTGPDPTGGDATWRPGEAVLDPQWRLSLLVLCAL